MHPRKVESKEKFSINMLSSKCWFDRVLKYLLLVDYVYN